jgi:NADPH:quinone reductase-like Zn-dependent oxidoreductase
MIISFPSTTGKATGPELEPGGEFSMNVYVIRKGSTSLDGLQLQERADPQPGPHEILIRVRAASFNYRDQLILTGRYFGRPVNRDLIPLSDGAGEVAAVGTGVSRFKVGDRVAGTFFQVWNDGTPPGYTPALGGTVDGMLAEQVVLHEDGVVAVPKNLSFEEAASLPCAGVTAWNALMDSGTRVKAGDSVLCMGTGGVSILALQFAKTAGARVIVTSSSDDKLQHARELGASEGVNYKRTPDWEKQVLELTNGRGVDHVIELGGVGTLARSFQAVAPGGKIALIGVLAGPTGDANPLGLMMKRASLHGIFVGSRKMFEDMNAAIEMNKIKPVVDKVFSFAKVVDAWQCFTAGDFVGKIAIRL